MTAESLETHPEVVLGPTSDAFELLLGAGQGLFQGLWRGPEDVAEFHDGVSSLHREEWGDSRHPADPLVHGGDGVGQRFSPARRVVQDERPQDRVQVPVAPLDWARAGVPGDAVLQLDAVSLAALAHVPADEGFPVVGVDDLRLEQGVHVDDALDDGGRVRPVDCPGGDVSGEAASGGEDVGFSGRCRVKGSHKVHADYLTWPRTFREGLDGPRVFPRALGYLELAGFTPADGSPHLPEQSWALEREKSPVRGAPGAPVA